MIDLQSKLEEHGVEVQEGGAHKHVRSGWLGVDCPKCGKGSGGFHLGINLEKKFASCWRCGYYHLPTLLTELTGESYSTVQDWLNTPSGCGGSPLTPSKPRGRIKLPRGVKVLRRQHRVYLRWRKFNPNEIIRLWGVRGIGMAARLSWRLWIPIHKDGNLVSWTTRSIGDDPTRYISAAPDEESESPRSLLYGMDHVRHAMIVCEGPTDVWRIGPGAVATMGLSYSQEQVSLMFFTKKGAGDI